MVFVKKCSIAEIPCFLFLLVLFFVYEFFNKLDKFKLLEFIYS